MTLIVFLLTALFIFLIGSTAYKVEKKNPQNFSFFLICICITLWLISYSAIYIAPPSMLLLVSRIISIPLFFVAPIGYFFMMNFPVEGKKFSNSFFVLNGIIIFILITLSFTDYYISGAGFNNNSHIFSPGPVYFIAQIYIAALISKGIISVLFKRAKFNGNERTLLNIVVSGIISGLGIGFLFAVLLPALGIPNYNTAAPIGVIFLVVLWAYALLKHQMMDVKLIIRKSASNLITVLIIIATSALFYSYFIVNFLHSEESILLSIIVLSVFWAFSGKRLQNFLITTAQRAFIKGWYNYAKTLQKFIDDYTKTSNLTELVKLTKEDFIDTAEMSPVNVYFPEQYELRRATADTFYEWQDNGSDEKSASLTKNGSLLKLLLEHKAVLTQRNKDATIKKTLAEHNIEALVPVMHDDDLIAVITIGRKLSEDPFNTDDINLLTAISTQFALVMDRLNQARVSAEVDVAQRIQTEILPKAPEVPGLELACYMRPADEVGGDYYDVVTVGDYSWIILGDVTGHGLASGLVMFMVQSIMTSILHTKENVTPSELNYIANTILFQNLERLDEQRPMTIASSCFKQGGKSFAISGSHDNILIYRKKSHDVESLALDHFPIGLGFTDLLSETDFQQESVNIQKGDIVFFITDGITEAVKSGDKDAELFGEERLIKIIKSHADKDSEVIKDKIVDELTTFAHDVFHDDVTFIVARVV